MLLKITESCRMECTHCMDNAKPNGKDMSMETFRNAIDFFNKYGGFELIISGAEPTEHPNFWKMLKYAAENAEGSVDLNGIRMHHITIATNAMNLVGNEHAYEMIKYYNNKYGNGITFQVTHVDKYYKHEIDLKDKIFLLDNVLLCKEIEHIVPKGRALINNIPYDVDKVKSSKCFNIRSISRTVKHLSDVSTILSSKLKFCTPQIDIYGNIKLGESALCPVCSSIYKKPEEIIEDIRNFKCKGCSIINSKLPERYLNAIGETKGDYL